MRLSLLFCVLIGLIGPVLPLGADPFLLGYSRQGRPLVVNHVVASGSAAGAILVVGGIHGKFEANTVDLVRALERQFANHPVALDLFFLDNLNPDSFAVVSKQGDDTPSGWRDGRRVGRAWYRFTSRYVDINRNFPTPDWQTDAEYNHGDQRPGAGGASPLSEPETAFLVEVIQALLPGYPRLTVVDFHSLNVNSGGPGTVQPAYTGPSDDPTVTAEDLDLATRYADAAGYEVISAWIAYPVHGEFLNWAGTLGLPAIDVELPDSRPVGTARPGEPSAFQRNLDALGALIVWLASGPS